MTIKKELLNFATCMKALAFLFAILIFGHSLGVCAPTFYRSAPKSQSISCKSENLSGKTAKCCKKTEHTDQKNDENKECCGDNCKCLCCIKVFVKNPESIVSKDIQKPFILKSIFPLFIHSFEYHSAPFHPPRIV